MRHGAVRDVVRLAMVVGLVHAGPAAAQYADTFVDPEFKDCARHAGALPGWNGNTGGSAFAGGGPPLDNHDLDGDRLFGSPAIPGGEDTDGDAVFGTIQAAINATQASGVVHIMTPGVYREALTVAGSITIRGTTGGGVVLDGGCGVVGVSQFPDVAVNVTASSVVVTLEHLTVRGYRDGLRPTTAALVPSDVTLRAVHCRFEDNTATGASSACIFNATGRIEALECEFHRNQQAVFGIDSTVVLAKCLFEGSRNTSAVFTEGDVGSLTVTDSTFARNAIVGIDSRVGPGALGHSVRVHRSSFISNGLGGLSVSSTASAPISVDACVISGNSGRGIDFFSYSANAALPARLFVRDSVIDGNTSDGIRLTTAAGACCGRASVQGTTIAYNGGVGLNQTGVQLTFNCTPGGNQLFFNAVNDPSMACQPTTVLSPVTQIN